MQESSNSSGPAMRSGRSTLGYCVLAVVLGLGMWGLFVDLDAPSEHNLEGLRERAGVYRIESVALGPCGELMPVDGHGFELYGLRLLTFTAELVGQPCPDLSTCRDTVREDAPYRFGLGGPDDAIAPDALDADRVLAVATTFSQTNDGRLGSSRMSRWGDEERCRAARHSFRLEPSSDGITIDARVEASGWQKGEPEEGCADPPMECVSELRLRLVPVEGR